MTPRIGVYICHCGSNIASRVDCKAVCQFAESLPGVVVAKEYRFMCSEPGQETIGAGIREQGLDRIVVAACSPRMHEGTFRAACERAGLNRHLLSMANIREQCAWVTAETAAATSKAKALVAAAISRSALLSPLPRQTARVGQTAMVVGGGIAGIQAALDIAESGRKVIMVEKDASVGGLMARMDKTFPTLDCAACILTPKMVQVGLHPNIDLLTWSRVESVSGVVGAFHVKVRREARYVDEERCTGCGLCWESCPARRLPAERSIYLGSALVGSTQPQKVNPTP